MDADQLETYDLIGSIDQGTSSTRFSVFNSITGLPVAYHQEEAERCSPKEGWTEMDPMWIIGSVERCIESTRQKLQDTEIDVSRIKCIGITNQMLTVIMWDRCTGKPLYNAIVWLDVRTHKENEEALDRIPNRNKNHFQAKTGVPLSAMFLNTKIPWMRDNVPGVRQAMDDGRCMIGTVNTWILWILTGGITDGVYLTDVTNACPTGLLNIHTLKWDEEVCNFFSIPTQLLPEIRSTSEIYGYVKTGFLQGKPISGMIGDQFGATVGQLCFKKGQSKCTYGTAGCLNINVGTEPVMSKYGLVTSPLFQLGPGAPVVYSVMGPIQGCGEVINWLRDNLGLIKDPKEIEQMASSVDSSHDCYFVPAFDGLMCPYWEDDARGIIVGITTFTNKNHICRAALESICFQISAILHVAADDIGQPLLSLYVDGGMVTNNLLMQIQADLYGKAVVRPDFKETTSLGAALMAGAATGVDIYKVPEDRHGLELSFPRHTDIFTPKISEEERERLIKRWNKAVGRSKDWLSH